VGGVPCIRGLRIPGRHRRRHDRRRDGEREILTAYPDLEAADIDEALHYAAEAVRERGTPLAAPG
jgi:uncharacterized protein (DUF433 family)